MKLRILFLLAISSLSLNAQVINFNVQGTVQKIQKAKFVYLVSLNEVKGKPDLFMISPLVNGQFQVSGKSNLDGALLRYGFLFLDERGDISLEDVKLNIKSNKWFVGGTACLKSIILENVKLEFENPFNISNSKILDGGFYLKQYEEVMLTWKNRDLPEFVKKYPDSPFSLIEIERLYNMSTSPIGGKMGVAQFGSPKDLFAALSPRMKKTKQGIELKRKMDQSLKIK
ncbi:hypothetical protein ACFOG5_18995 [Pedobacter fastidiosus]|uniref:DUF4369 domain-containing protein n=1 Tax=Pedobacter fastidiosus TaxID=2765361 RepID=A0ABR7KT26_9SPHI|nr:hypothetical protein [Pedobacter fastidiosus]MBC6111166.1 hypothetical protein [Pedobacter fastidiosus]